MRPISKRFNLKNFENRQAKHYQVLGLKEGASFEEIKEAFHRKCESMNLEVGPEGIEKKVDDGRS
jgi:hypothetical protein